MKGTLLFAFAKDNQPILFLTWHCLLRARVWHHWASVCLLYCLKFERDSFLLFAVVSDLRLLPESCSHNLWPVQNVVFWEIHDMKVGVNWGGGGGGGGGKCMYCILRRQMGVISVPERRVEGIASPLIFLSCTYHCRTAGVMSRFQLCCNIAEISLNFLIRTSVA